MRHKPVAKLSRSLGFPLTEKAAKYFERRPYPPGQRRQGKTLGAYKVRLVEKQRLKAQYNISEKQLRRAFDTAVRNEGRTGFNLIEDLETRLDALVMRAGWAKTIYQARQFVSHKHILVDGKSVNRPAYRVAVGQKISVRPKSKSMDHFQYALSTQDGSIIPGYLQVTELQAELVKRPTRPQVPVICDEQLVVEYYAR